MKIKFYPIVSGIFARRFFSCVCFTFLLLTCLPSFSQTGADSLLNFIKQNKNRASFFLQQNDSVMARLNENKLTPLASTVKIMVAIEFAKQVSKGVIDEEDEASLKEIDKYFVPAIDGNAQAEWIEFETNEKHIKNDSIKLIDVARGMMMYNSNANTEYLMDLLGFTNVKNNVQLFGLNAHTPIYPPVASLFMFQNPNKTKVRKVLKEVRVIPEEEYARYIIEIHNKLKEDDTYKQSFHPQEFYKMQKLWSDRLPASTTKEYVKLVSIINNRRYFDNNMYGIIAEILETIMENPANDKWLAHAGVKGGSTVYVLTRTIYATLKNRTKIEMAYFFNDLKVKENARLQGWMNDFEMKVLSDENFRKKIKL